MVNRPELVNAQLRKIRAPVIREMIQSSSMGIIFYLSVLRDHREIMHLLNVCNIIKHLILIDLEGTFLTLLKLPQQQRLRSGRKIQQSASVSPPACRASS